MLSFVKSLFYLDLLASDVEVKSYLEYTLNS